MPAAEWDPLMTKRAEMTSRDPKAIDLDTILASDPAVIDIVHRDWKSQVRLEASSRRAFLTLDASRGTFMKLGNDLEILWDAAGMERFRLVDGCLVQLELLSTLPERLVEKPVKPLVTEFRVAVVTAYYKEPKAFLERCLRSVRGQTVAVDHILVADGLPQDWIEAEGVRHIRLDKSHGDYGNTPRGIGSLLAIAENYDAIAFLDADNWFEPHHIELAIQTRRNAGKPCDVVFGQRNMMRPDETIIPVVDEPIEAHVDTNCFVFFRGSFHILQTFALIPRELSAIGDRIFYANLRKADLSTAIMPTKTVNYHCIWASIYADAGEVPPADAKPNIDQKPLMAWIAALTPEKRLEVSRRTGLQLD